MSEHVSTLLIAWFLFLLIGGWLLANALIDLGASWLRERIRSRKTVVDVGESSVVSR